MSENMKRKLTSRKFWAALAGFIAMLIAAFGVSESTAAQVSAIIMSGASVVAYIIGEGLADAAGAQNADAYHNQPPDAGGTDDEKDAE